MKVGTKLILIFIISGIVITFLLSWIIEFYKYQKRLVLRDDVAKAFEDVNSLVRKVYPRTDRETLADNTKKVFESALSKIPRKCLPIDAFKYVQPVLSALNDENLRIYPPFEPVYSVLPFSVIIVDGKAVVNSSAVENIKAGDEIVEINGKSVDKVISELLVFTSGENYLVKEQQLPSLFQLIPELLDKKKDAVGIFYKQKEYNVKLRSENGEKEINVKTLTAFSYPRESAQYPALPSRSPFEFTRNGDIGILKLGTFQLSGTMFNRYREFLDNTFVQNRDLKVLLLDLRGVSSRDFTIFKELYEHLVPNKVSVKRRISVVNTAYNMDLLEKYGFEFTQTTGELLRLEFEHTFIPRDPFVNADVWILFDRYTSNAALDFIYTFRKLRKSRTIGEPTLMKINHTTDLNFRYDDKLMTTFSFPTAILSEDNGESGLMPDFTVDMNTEKRIQYIKGEGDYMLNEALKIINSDQ
ncbi:MAG: hypothetical protein WHS64_05440 [Fervidobacterium sp.]|uniref:hypothetical protein n=1 Tax=Fervidobacterium TaxID=2422 RepID=UPI00220846A6|nr:hypothetical protein IB67_08640 [Fervidobacterium riparium]